MNHDILVEIIEPGIYYGGQCKKGEMIVAHRVHAIEWEYLNRVRIVDSWSKMPEERFKEDVTVMLKAGKLSEIYDIIEECIYELANQQHKGSFNGKVGWIEKIHEQGVSDGRKQILDLLFVPYCKNTLKMSEEDFVKWVSSWMVECEKKRPMEFKESYVRQRFRRGEYAA